MFQSTHPRGVRLMDNPRYARVFDVSIHAPAWGATKPSVHEPEKEHVSIHAPAWGATKASHSFQIRRFGFNPRTRVGCDILLLRILLAEAGFNPRTRVGCDAMRTNRYRRFFEVSIHAPAWGATSPKRQHHHREGKFQSTHPRGVRRASFPGLCVDL